MRSNNTKTFIICQKRHTSAHPTPWDTNSAVEAALHGCSNRLPVMRKPHRSAHGSQQKNASLSMPEVSHAVCPPMLQEERHPFPFPCFDGYADNALTKHCLTCNCHSMRASCIRHPTRSTPSSYQAMCSSVHPFPCNPSPKQMSCATDFGLTHLWQRTTGSIS